MKGCSSGSAIVDRMENHKISKGVYVGEYTGSNSVDSNGRGGLIP